MHEDAGMIVKPSWVKEIEIKSAPAPKIIETIEPKAEPTPEEQIKALKAQIKAIELAKGIRQPRKTGGVTMNTPATRKAKSEAVKAKIEKQLQKAKNDLQLHRAGWEVLTPTQVVDSMAGGLADLV